MFSPIIIFLGSKHHRAFYNCIMSPAVTNETIESVKFINIHGNKWFVSISLNFKVNTTTILGFGENLV